MLLFFFSSWTQNACSVAASTLQTPRWRIPTVLPPLACWPSGGSFISLRKIEMTVSGIISQKTNILVGNLADQVPRLFWTQEQTANRLGLSLRTLFELRKSHPLYAPDGTRTIIANPKKDLPLWSDDLVQLIAFARTLTIQGVRQLTDDEALKIRVRMGEKKRRQYLAHIDD